MANNGSRSNISSSSKKWILGAALLILIALVAGGAGFLFNAVIQPFQPGNIKTEIVDVTKGQSPQSVARQLEALRIIRNQTLFYWFGKVKGHWGYLKAGEYELSPAMSADQIFQILRSGISASKPFLVREGENSFEIAKGLEAHGYGTANEFLKLIRDPLFIQTLGISGTPPENLEGYLYPDTYLLTHKMTQPEIARLMVKRFTEKWGPNEDQKAFERGMTRQQIVTLASIVEKETGAPQERPMIAGVFYNRLKKKMRLQSDPTSIYGIWARYNGNISKRDLHDENPYNTYHVPGLPIGPISNPGWASIQATLQPNSHPYLYFVSQNDGTHVFSETYEEHQRAVTKFQMDRKAREGKSWRDLTKRQDSVVAVPTPAHK